MFRSALSIVLVLALSAGAHAQDPDGPPPEGTPSGTTLPSMPPAPLPPPTQPTRPSVAPGLVLAPLQHQNDNLANYPHDIYERRRPRIGLLVAGVSMLAAGYVADVAFTYGYDHQPAGTSLIPVVGPFLQLKQRYGLDGPPVDTGSAEADARANKTLASADSTIRGLARAGEVVCGVLQVAGVVLIVVGAVLKRKLRAAGNERTSTGVLKPMQNSSLSLRF